MASNSTRTPTLAEEYVDEALFDGKVGTLEQHLERKRVLAHPLRYSLVYLLHEEEDQRMTHPQMVKAAGLDEDELMPHLDDLLTVNLIARVPEPDGLRGSRTFYRITSLGRQAIANDLDSIKPGETAHAGD